MSKTTYNFAPTGTPGGTGTQTWTAPSTLLNGNIYVNVAGSMGPGSTDPRSPGSSLDGAGGNGDSFFGTIPAAPSQTFTIQCGSDDRYGYHNGGFGGFGSSRNGWQGGGSSALLTGGTVIIEAAGGGGGGGGETNDNNHGGNGSGGNLTASTAGNGVNNAYGANFGFGGSGTAGGAAGLGAQAGSPASGGTGGAGGQSAGSNSGGGGGGGGGHIGGGGGGGGGGNSSGGGGAGGQSYVATTVGVAGHFPGSHQNNGLVTITVTVADAPLVSTLTSPSSGSYASLNPTFDWTYNPGADSGTQQSYALRIKYSGGSYQYWNAGTSSLQSAIVWNTSTATSVALTGLTPGTTYDWSVATAESNYGLQGPFATDSSFTVFPLPALPALQIPYNNSYEDLANTPTFSAVYNNTDGSTCAAYQFERVGPAGTRYWNAGSSAWATSPVWNPGGMSITFPSGSWSDGHTYTWTFNSQSSNGSAYTSGFANPFTVHSQAAPVITYTLPASNAETIIAVEATATTPAGISVTQWQCNVVLASDLSTVVWTSGLVTGTLPSQIVPTVPYGPLYVAEITVTETHGLSSTSFSDSFQIIYPQYATVTSTAITTTVQAQVGVGWKPGYITPLSAVLPTSLVSTVYNSFTLIRGVQFATQQSDPVQVIPYDTFDNASYYSTYSFPSIADAAAAGINDFTAYGNAVLTYLPTTSSVLLTQSPASAVPSTHSMVRILPSPVLAEGGPSVASSSSGGIYSPSVTVSGSGNVYPAVRFTALNALTANLQLINATTGAVIQEWPLSVAAGQTVQAYRTYVVGSQAPTGTPLQVGLVVTGLTNSLEIRALSLFDEGIEWSFSADGGTTFVPALGVRNSPYGVVSFPTPGTQLMWQATFYRQAMYINRIRMRPFYVANRRLAPPVASQGPTVTFNDPSWSVYTDPLFNDPCPIPSSWFVASAVSLTPTS